MVKNLDNPERLGLGRIVSPIGDFLSDFFFSKGRNRNKSLLVMYIREFFEVIQSSGMGS